MLSVRWVVLNADSAKPLLTSPLTMEKRQNHYHLSQVTLSIDERHYPAEVYMVAVEKASRLCRSHKLWEEKEHNMVMTADIKTGVHTD